MRLAFALSLLASCPACNQDGLGIGGGGQVDLSSAAASHDLTHDSSGPDLTAADLAVGGPCTVLWLDGKPSSVVQVPASNAFDPQGSLTVEGWFWRAGGVGDASSLVSHGSPPDFTAGWGLQVGGLIGCTLLFDGNQDRGATAPIQSKWSHVAGVYDARVQAMRCYVDGVGSEDTAVHKPLLPVNAALEIGPVRGYAAEIRVSASARYSSKFVPAARLASDADTVTLYHLDEPVGAIAHDASGHGYDGMLLGAAGFVVPPVCP